MGRDYFGRDLSNPSDVLKLSGESQTYSMNIKNTGDLFQIPRMIVWRKTFMQLYSIEENKEVQM